MDKNIFYIKFENSLKNLFNVLNFTIDDRSSKYFDLHDEKLNEDNLRVSESLKQSLLDAISKYDTENFSMIIKKINEDSIYRKEIYLEALKHAMILHQTSLELRLRHMIHKLVIQLDKDIKEFDFKYIFDLFYVYLNQGRFEVSLTIVEKYFEFIPNKLYERFAMYLIKNKYKTIEQAKESHRTLEKDKLGSKVFQEYHKQKNKVNQTDRFLIDMIGDIIEYQKSRSISKHHQKVYRKERRRDFFVAFGKGIFLLFRIAVLVATGIFGYIFSANAFNHVGMETTLTYALILGLMLVVALIFRVRKYYGLVVIMAFGYYVFMRFLPDIEKPIAEMVLLTRLKDVIQMAIDTNLLALNEGSSIISNLNASNHILYGYLWFLYTVIATVFFLFMSSINLKGKVYLVFKKVLGILGLILALAPPVLLYLTTDVLKALYFETNYGNIVLLVFISTLIEVVAIYLSTKLISDKTVKYSIRTYTFAKVFIIGMAYLPLTSYEMDGLMKLGIVVFFLLASVGLQSRFLRKITKTS